MADFTLKLDGLNALRAALKKAPKARIGILGSNNAREGDVANNSQIGSAHEFGTSTIPQRSFLRIPITENLTKELESSGAFTKEALDQVVASKSMKPWVEKMAVVAEGIVADAFEKSGPNWAPLKESTLKRKKVNMLLVESQQLRNSITSEVID